MQDAVTQPVYRRRWFFVTVIVLLLGAIILTALPFGLSYAVNNWLRQNGGEQVAIRDVDFNLFTGRASIEDLRLSVGQRELMAIPRLELDLDWLPLFSRQVVVRSVLIHGVDLEIEQLADGSLRIGGINQPESETGDAGADAAPWDFGLDKLKIVNSSVHYRSPDLELETRLNELTLTRLTTWASEPAPLEFAGSVNGAAVRLNGQLPPLSSGVGYAGQVSVTGLKLDAFARLAQAAIGGLDGQLTIDTHVDVLQSSGKPLTVSQDGKIRTDGLAFERDGSQLAYARLQWDGTMTVSVPPGEAAMELGLRGEVSGDSLAVTMPAEALDLHQGSFLWNGEVAVRGGEPGAATAAGRVKLGDVAANVTDSKIQLARIRDIDVGEFVLQDTGDITVSKLALTEALFAKESEDSKAPAGGGALAAGAIAVDRLQVTAGNQIAIGTMEWRDVTYFARREADGKMHIVRIIDTLPFANREKTAEAVAAEAGTATDEPAGAMRLDELRITGDSKLLFNDATVKPAFDMRLELTEAVIKNIDTAKPAQDSSVLIKGRLDKHSRISIKGTLQPFAERPTLNLESHLEGIALTEVSPYTVSTLGYALKSGHLDADSTIGVDQGKLDIGNKLTIRGLEVTAVENASREKLDQQMSVPLDTALNMLRDKHDTIKLDLPVSGDIDSPDFDISDAVNTAVSKALKQGAKTYLLLALQPYGSLISLATMAGEAASRVRLDPVLFAAGGDAVPVDTHAYLEKVAGILTDRPELNIKVCGLAGEQDRLALGGPVYASPTAGGRLPDTLLEPAQSPSAVVPPPPQAAAMTDEKLLKLAEQRAAAVTDFLVTQHGVTASRLVTCQPSIDSEADAAGRVDLLI